MSTALPARSTLDGSGAPTTAAMKTALGALRDFLAETLGADSALPVGTWTPTLTNGTNVSSSTAYALWYIRLGNTVFFAGPVSVTPTAAGSCLIDLSLPVASAFTTSRQASGTATYNASSVASGGYGSIYSEATNDRLQIRLSAGTTGAQQWCLIGSYQIIP